MGRVNDDVVGDVGIDCHLVVLGRRVYVDSTGVVGEVVVGDRQQLGVCLLYTSPSPRDS